jgi:hypothetical protein
MIDKQVWFTRDAGRGLGVDIVEDEPSHIHIPRPSRVVHLSEEGTAACRPLASFQAPLTPPVIVADRLSPSRRLRSSQR